MARPLRLHIPGMVYHVMSRGNAKQVIFTDKRDYERYLEVLDRGLKRFDVRCLAYCLLGNHLHLLLQPNQFPIARMMQQVNSTYCQWFNRRHRRVGHVLQGRYKAQLVETGESMLRVLRYVLMNPVAARRVSHPAQWRWSSCRATLSGKNGMPGFDAISVALQSVLGTDWQQRMRDEIAASNPADAAPDGFILGSREFVRRFSALLSPHRHNDSFVLAQRYASRPTLDELLPQARDRVSCAAGARRAFHEHAYTLREIGCHLKRSSATVWCWIRSTVSRPLLETAPTSTPGFS